MRRRRENKGLIPARRLIFFRMPLFRLTKILITTGRRAFVLKKSAHFFNKHEAYLNYEDSRQSEGRQRLPQDVRVA